MAASPQAGAEGSKMYDELLAVHMIMRRGAALVTASFARLTAGEDVDVRALVKTSRWLIEFVHHHHASEDELFWPVLRGLFPASIAVLDSLTVEHEALDTELHTLARAVDGIADPDVTGERAKTLAVVGRAALSRPAVGAEGPGPPGDPPGQGGTGPARPVPPGPGRRHHPRPRGHRPRRAAPQPVPGVRPDGGPGTSTGLRGDGSQLPGPLRRLRPLLLTRYRTTKKSLGATR